MNNTEAKRIWPECTKPGPDGKALVTFPSPSKSTVEQIAGRIRHREHYARKQKRMRLKAAVLTAEGKL